MASCPYCELSLIPPEALRCPRCGTELSRHRPEPRQVPATLAVSRIMSSLPADGLGAEPPGQKTRVEQSVPVVRPLCPLQRPPLALVCLFDDGQETGEWIRVRTARLSIGRTAGEVTIAHDGAISSKHAELRRDLVDGEYCWFFKDLGSTNGTFARVSQSTIAHNQELLLGCRRFRFDAAPQFGAAPASGTEEAADATRMFVPGQRAQQEIRPALVERLAEGDGERFELPEEEAWIGTDPQQTSITLRDPFLNPRHARIFRDAQGRWQIEDHQSHNGTWIGIDQIQIWDSGEFLVGEQRLLVKVF